MTATDQTTIQTPLADGIILSDVAAGKVKSLLESEGRDDLALRVAVQPGGCSGLRYQLFFDERNLDGDVVSDFNGVSVVETAAQQPSRAPAQWNESPQAQEPVALGLSIVKPCFSMVSTKSMTAPLR
jgi:hypothetical protein